MHMHVYYGSRTQKDIKLSIRLRAVRTRHALRHPCTHSPNASKRRIGSWHHCGIHTSTDTELAYHLLSLVVTVTVTHRRLSIAVFTFDRHCSGWWQLHQSRGVMVSMFWGLVETCDNIDEEDEQISHNRAT